MGKDVYKMRKMNGKRDEALQLKYLYTGLLLFLLIVIGVTYWSQENFAEETKWIRHSNRVLRSLESIQSSIVDAETGHRGYQLTQDTTFLRPYYQSMEEMESNIELVDSLLLNHQAQRKRKDTLKRMIQAQYDIISEILLSENGVNNVLTKHERNLMIHGKINMDKIRGMVNNMKVEEELILSERLSKAQMFRTLNPLVLLLFAILALGGATFLFIMLTKELERRKQAEYEMLTYNEVLKRSNEDLEQFAYVASHDLQEPLRKIRAFGDRLQMKYKDGLDESGKDYVDRMQAAAERMQNLIDDLLSFSRISRKSNVYAEVDLNIVIRQVLDDMEFNIENSRAKIDISSLPTVNGDVAQLKRLFQNLISNAIKFKKPDTDPIVGISSHVATDEEVEKYLEPGIHSRAYHLITIQDNGIGFDEKYAQKIFVIFQRLHGRADYAGTGIGLAICRKIVMNHKGWIKVQSKEGIGSQFLIFLPIEFEHQES